MAYARWCESNWYAFWAGKIPPITVKADEVLSLWHDMGEMPEWTYQALREVVDSGGLDGFLVESYGVLTPEDLAEAKDIIARFIHDVDGSYKIDNNK